MSGITNYLKKKKNSLNWQYLEEAHNNYKDMKNKLLEAGTLSSDRSFNAISDDLVSDVSW